MAKDERRGPFEEKRDLFSDQGKTDQLTTQINNVVRGTLSLSPSLLSNHDALLAALMHDPRFKKHVHCQKTQKPKRISRVYVAREGRIVNILF